jgi:hypothetical protein
MIHSRYWGQRALHHAFMVQALVFKLRHPLTPLYWYLIAMGYRTYLMMARNLVEYWPRWDRPTPPEVRALIDSISEDKFGSSYKIDRGVIEHQVCEATLNERVAPFTPEVLQIPEIAFFTGVNPDYSRGVELACLGRMDARFFALAVRKWFKGARKSKMSRQSRFAVSAPARDRFVQARRFNWVRKREEKAHVSR